MGDHYSKYIIYVGFSQFQIKQYYYYYYLLNNNLKQYHNYLLPIASWLGITFIADRYYI